MSNTIFYSNDNDFEQDVLNAKQPVLVDFYADWCPPCQMIAPSLEALAKEYQGKAKIVKINVDQNPELSMKFDVRNIPTLITFRNGEVIDRTAGASEIRVDINVESSNASRAEVEALIAEIPNHSPLYDMFTNPVPVVHRIV
ncbi:thioredoxin [Actinobacillus ureae ATCC 25976]|uniref:Thioredoxin n=1 Tax=Actinobacillus ureae ATCC 25976 TaxID=887324 RepID=E8KK69_9PAST|nr:thioredoxin [Actinobacillus ureae]EFX90716.1 thioredoxin [Actinobacillus ureae ATCC 25976]